MGITIYEEFVKKILHICLFMMSLTFYNVFYLPSASQTQLFAKYTEIDIGSSLISVMLSFHVRNHVMYSHLAVCTYQRACLNYA